MLTTQRSALCILTLSLLLFTEVFTSESHKRKSKHQNDFDVHWNVPTYLCNTHKIPFESKLKEFGIIVNKNDNFRGEKINILYDPGMFPIYLKNKETGDLIKHNGGIPQLGNLTEHLIKFRQDVEKLVEINFSGLGIIDFEVWRPVFRQHWNAQVIYKEMSLNHTRESNPTLRSKELLEKKAKEEFESAAKKFMEQTLKEVKKLRPKAKWGYYGFPYCLNYEKEECPNIVKEENDGISWLFNESTGLYLSVYMSRTLSEEVFASKVKGRLDEAKRVSTKISSSGPSSVHPYVWYRYHDSFDFLTKESMKSTLKLAKERGMGGIIMWGSSGDLKTKEKCQELMDYLMSTLGPLVKDIKKKK